MYFPSTPNEHTKARVAKREEKAPNFILIMGRIDNI
jgi:hypothetical protein